MKVTEDDRRPNAFSPAADLGTQTTRFRQMRAGRRNYVVADLQLKHATALSDGAVMLVPVYLITSTPAPCLFQNTKEDQRYRHPVENFVIHWV
ncbi:uncharacterized protein V6R79_010087 [Siganus canaliculatus]